MNVSVRLTTRARSTFALVTTVSLLAAVTPIACSSESKRTGFEADGTPDGGGGFATADAGEGSTCEINNVAANPDEDSDGDGYPLKLDCNECDPKINGGAFDVPGNGVDEDCDGTADNEVAVCDEGVAIEPTDPFDAAKAIGLCKQAKRDGKEWGLISARYIRPDGTSATTNVDVGVLPKFGVNTPPAGKAMLLLSSGWARSPTDPGYNPGTKVGWSRDKNVFHGTPKGYPKEFAGCPAGTKSGKAQDGIGLEVVVRVPSNAKSLRYQQNFFTHEYSMFVCTEYNDFFVTLMDPPPPGLADGNIAFDSLSNPISVNNGLLQVCAPGTFKTKVFTCPLGVSTLEQTGYETRGATGWLTTRAEVVPGSEITLRFAIWDSNDGYFDSTVVLDDFAFETDGAAGAQTLPTPPR